MQTAEDMYNLYHRAVLYREKGVYPGRIGNFTKARGRADWIYFERFASLVIRSQGHVDAELFITALADFFGGRFPAKMLVHPKGMKMYKSVRDQRNAESDPSLVRAGVLRSLEFIVKFMKERGLQTLDEYFELNAYIVPEAARHFSAGSVTKHFLALVPDIESIIKQYPSDIRAEYFNGIGEWLPRARINAGRDEKLRKLSVRMNETISALVTNEN